MICIGEYYHEAKVELKTTYRKLIKMYRCRSHLWLLKIPQPSFALVVNANQCIIMNYVKNVLFTHQEMILINLFA